MNEHFVLFGSPIASIMLVVVFFCILIGFIAILWLDRKGLLGTPMKIEENNDDKKDS